MANPITIGGIEVTDPSDPCKLCEALRIIKLRRMSGDAATEIEQRSAVQSRRVKWDVVPMATLEAEIERLQRECDGRNGKRRRFAKSFRFTPSY